MTTLGLVFVENKLYEYYNDIKNKYALIDLHNGQPIRNFPILDSFDITHDREIFWINLPIKYYEFPQSWNVDFDEFKNAVNSILEAIVELNINTIVDTHKPIRFGFRDLDTTLLIKLRL